MKVTDILSSTAKPFPSLEFVPPLKGGDINKLYQALDPLLEFKPPFINVTCHRDERADGRVVTKRPGTVAIAAAIMKRFKIEVVPHILCAYASREEIENELIDLNFLDIENVLALRGETSADRMSFTPFPDGHSHSAQLVRQIVDLNNGRYIDNAIISGVPTHFCIGVAGYPEKHYEAASMDEDIRHLKEKVDAGAGYIITQMFFDNRHFYKFRDLCRKEGITVPIIPGLKPVSSKKQLTSLPKAFSISLPDTLEYEVNQCRDDAQVYETGIRWAILQSRDLLKHGVPAIHYYTMGRGDNIREILKEVF